MKQLIIQNKNNAKEEYREYCKDILSKKKNDYLSMQEASYWICDATSIYTSFMGIDPVEGDLGNVMDIACDLEVDKEHCDRDCIDFVEIEEYFKD